MAVARSHRVVFSCCYGEMTSVALEEGGPKKAQYEERSDDVLGEIVPTPRPSTRLASLRPVAEAASGRLETR
jgi:hypothetical protein